MKILVLGATGTVGAAIATEARARGHEVTGAARRAGSGIEAVDATDSVQVAAAATGHDAVVLAVAPPRDGTPPTGPLVAAGASVLAGLRTADVARLIVVGGAGSLRIATGLRLLDSPDFPPAFRPEAEAQAALLDVVKSADGLEWTYISPAAQLEPGRRTGRYRRGADDLIVADDGTSAISVEDYAFAVLDELENPRAVGRRIAVGY